MGDYYPVVKVAAVNSCPVFLNREATVEKACELILEAGRGGAKVIVFPESYIPGHPIWYKSNQTNSEITQRLSVELFKNSLEVPGTETLKIGRAAKDAGAYVIMGCCEKRFNTTGTMFNTYLYFNPDGELVFKHQKSMPTTVERLVHAMGGPETMGLIQTEFGPMSGLLCGENSNPLAIFSNIMGGTRIHAAGWPNFFTLSRKAMMKQFVQIVTQGVAYMAKCYVISACSTLNEDAIKKLEVSPETEVLLRDPERCGGSMIAGPSGLLIAGPIGSEEEILYADCDLSLCIQYKLSHDFSGLYNRPDIFTLIQRKQPYHLYVEETCVPTSDTKLQRTSSCGMFFPQDEAFSANCDTL